MKSVKITRGPVRLEERFWAGWSFDVAFALESKGPDWHHCRCGLQWTEYSTKLGLPKDVRELGQRTLAALRARTISDREYVTCGEDPEEARSRRIKVLESHLDETNNPEGIGNVVYLWSRDSDVQTKPFQGYFEYLHDPRPCEKGNTSIIVKDNPKRRVPDVYPNLVNDLHIWAYGLSGKDCKCAHASCGVYMRFEFRFSDRGWPIQEQMRYFVRDMGCR